MSKTISGYLVDPYEGTVISVKVNRGDFNKMYKLMDCDCFDVARLSDGNTCYVDDTGLLSNKPLFALRTYPCVLAGKALILGPPDQDGNDTDCRLEKSWFIRNCVRVDQIEGDDRTVIISSMRYVEVH